MTLAVIGIGASILLVVTVLVLDLTGWWRRAAFFRWQGAGLLLMFGAIEARGIAMLRGWPGSRLGALGMYTWPVMMAGIMLVMVGGIVLARSRRGRADGPSNR